MCGQGDPYALDKAPWLGPITRSCGSGHSCQGAPPDRQQESHFRAKQRVGTDLDGSSYSLRLRSALPDGVAPSVAGSGEYPRFWLIRMAPIPVKIGVTSSNRDPNWPGDQEACMPKCEANCLLRARILI